jgi:hypothetical protein
LPPETTLLRRDQGCRPCRNPFPKEFREPCSPTRCIGPAWVRAWWSRIEARSGFAEAAVDRGLSEGPVNLGRTAQLRHRDSGHLHRHPRRARGGSLGEPEPGAVAESEEVRPERSPVRAKVCSSPTDL